MGSGVLDRRLGVSDKQSTCETCGARLQVRLDAPTPLLGTHPLFRYNTARRPIFATVAVLDPNPPCCNQYTVTMAQLSMCLTRTLRVGSTAWFQPTGVSGPH